MWRSCNNGVVNMTYEGVLFSFRKLKSVLLLHCMLLITASFTSPLLKKEYLGNIFFFPMTIMEAVFKILYVQYFSHLYPVIHEYSFKNIYFFYSAQIYPSTFCPRSRFANERWRYIQTIQRDVNVYLHLTLHLHKHLPPSFSVALYVFSLTKKNQTQ